MLLSAINVFAETADLTGITTAISSSAIGQPENDIDTIIKENATEERVQEWYNMFKVDMPLTYDTSIYLLEYHVSTEYWSEVSEMSYEGMIEPIKSYPTIYIPLFGEIADTNGILFNRVIGYIKLSYDARDEGYKLRMTMYNLSSDSYKDRETFGFYENIVNYLNRDKVIAQQIFMIKYPSSLTDGQDIIAVIKTSDSTIILDVGDSLRTITLMSEIQTPHPYSITEYSSLRKEVEKEIYRTADGWENNPAGGNVVQNQNDEITNEYLLLICLATLSFAVVITIVITKLYKRSAK
jgi:hypothetical protein